MGGQDSVLKARALGRVQTRPLCLSTHPGMHTMFISSNSCSASTSIMPHPGLSS